MLQRAASNAYSWWWASHIRTKQSKWLEQSLQDMEEKVNDTLNIIDDDGDSFAKRAEMYYRKRPELIAFVEESYKSYRALAERYDHLSRELQSVNRKIATAFPEEVQFDLDDDEEEEEEEEEEEDDTSAMSGSSPEKQAKDLPDGQRSRIPKAPCVPGKDFRSPSMLIRRKGQLRRTPSYAKGPMTVPASGLSKDDAVEEIDKLQKEILSLQTEKEFVKSVFKRGKGRYWEIESQVTEMQQKVCCLQDEFSIGIVIEDNEARTLIAATALKSCQEALVKLQGRHRQSEEDVKVEDEKIQEAYEKFQRLRGISLHRNEGQGEQTEEKHSTPGDNWRIKSPSPKVNTEQREKAGLELAREKMMEEIDAKVSVPELAEKIDDLVDKVVNLETEVSSQAALVRRLRLETAVLQAHIQALEGEKANSPTDGSEKMRDKLKEFEDELKRVKDLKQHVVSQCQNLLTHFTEASSNIASLSEKLESLNLGDEVEMTGLFREAKAGLDGKHGGEEIRNPQDMKVDDGGPKEEEDMKDGRVPTVHDPVKTRQEESFVLSGPCSEFDALSEKPQESMQHDKEEGQDLFDAVTEITNQESEEGRDEDDQPNWKQLFLNGLEDTEKILLDEYTSVLRSYKDVKSKLNEVEKKNRDSLFELAMEIRELRNANAQKEAELEALHQKLHDTPGLTTQDGNPSATTSNNGCNEPPPPSTTTATSCKQPLYKLLLLHNDRFTRPVKCKYGGVNLSKIGKAPVVPTVEEKLRMEIDELMEENLVFWLRFSTSIHQIQKFQTTFHDLQAELLKLKDAKVQQEGSSNNGSGEPANSEVRPIYKHLREIQTEIKLWFEHNEMLNEELQNRSMALRDIQDEISRVLVMGSSAVGGDNLITEYQAAKFQGEVLNMRQENKKVEDELRIGLDRVRKLQADIERTLKNLDADLRMSASRKQQSHPAQSSSSSRSRIPLRSFLFGVKLKKQKASLFSCASPALQKQYSDIRPIELPITESPT